MGWYPLRLKKLPKTGPAMPQPMMSTTGGDIVVFVFFTTADLEIRLLIVMTRYIAGDLPPCGDEASSPVFNFSSPVAHQAITDPLVSGERSGIQDQGWN